MAFNEKLEKKLKKILAKAGLDEDKVDAIVDEVEGALVEEDVPEDVNPGEDAVPPSENEGEVPSEEEVVQEEAAPEEVVEEVAQEEVPPTDGNIEQALNELAAQEGEATPDAEVAPIPQEPIVPQIDPSEIQKLADDLGEANKTIQGLLARIDSLEEALKGAGVITSDSKVGDETPRITPNANSNNEDAFDDIIATINGK